MIIQTKTTCALENHLRISVPYVTPQTHTYRHYRELGAGKISKANFQQRNRLAVQPTRSTKLRRCIQKMIKALKEAIYAVLKEADLVESGVYGTENLLNSRPLISVSRRYQGRAGVDPKPFPN